MGPGPRQFTTHQANSHPREALKSHQTPKPVSKASELIAINPKATHKYQKRFHNYGNSNFHGKQVFEIRLSTDSQLLSPRRLDPDPHIVRKNSLETSMQEDTILYPEYLKTLSKYKLEEIPIQPASRKIEAETPKSPFLGLPRSSQGPRRCQSGRAAHVK